MKHGMENPSAIVGRFEKYERAWTQVLKLQRIRNKRIKLENTEERLVG